MLSRLSSTSRVMRGSCHLMSTVPVKPFHYQELFDLSQPDPTPYRKLTGDYVETVEVSDRERDREIYIERERKRESGRERKTLKLFLLFPLILSSQANGKKFLNVAPEGLTLLASTAMVCLIFFLSSHSFFFLSISLLCLSFVL